MIKFLGLFHFIHSPLLIILPFLTNTWDKCYINYFFTMMFSYTFTDGECPITYASKRLIHDYSPRNNQFPEMEFIMEKKYIPYYFGIMSFIYVLKLAHVIIRTRHFSFIFVILFIYFLLFTFPNKWTFPFQEFTKIVLSFYLISDFNLYATFIFNHIGRFYTNFIQNGQVQFSRRH